MVKVGSGSSFYTLNLSLWACHILYIRSLFSIFGLLPLSSTFLCLSMVDLFCKCICLSYSFFLQINDRYEFPLQLDLDRENGKYLSPDADRSVRNLYTLHRCYFKPCLERIWSFLSILLTLLDT